MDIKGMRVLSVDDNYNNLMMVEVFARKLGLDVESYNDPMEAIRSAEKERYDIVIVDYMMPVINGLEFIKLFRQIDEVSPIVMVTAVGDDEAVQVQALEMGATDFLGKPLNYALFSGRVKNLLKLKKAHVLLEERALQLEEEVKGATKDILGREYEALRVLGRTAEYKDPETGDHIARVAGYTKAIAKAYGLSPEEQEVFYHAAPLHDIGKVGIQDSVLLKPGKLNEEEWAIMRQHPFIGFNILKNSESEYLKIGGIIAFTHHEKFDGSGYPNGLKGHQIPLVGRIVAVADVFDALTTRRPYKEPWSINEAMAYIQKEAGHHFDPEVVDAFFRSYEDIKAIHETVGPDEVEQ